MKTPLQIQKEIDDLEVEGRLLGDLSTTIEKAKYKKICSRVVKLRQLKAYLLQGATELFLNKEKDRIENRINEITPLFNPHGLEKKGDFERKWDLPKLKQQLNDIKYLLS